MNHRKGIFANVRDVGVSISIDDIMTMGMTMTAMGEKLKGYSVRYITIVRNR